MTSEPLQHFRAFITESFTAVAVNVFNEVQNLVQNYEDENKRLRTLLNSVLLPEVQLSRIDVGTRVSRLTAPESQSKAFPEIVFKEEQMEFVINDDLVKTEPDLNPVSGPYSLVELNDSSATTSVSGSDVVDDERRDEEGEEMEEAEPFVDDNDEELTEESLNAKPEADTGQLLPSDSTELHNNKKTDGESEIDASVFPQMFCNMDEGSASTEFQEANSAPLLGFDSFTAVSMELGFMGPLSMRTSSTETASPLEPNNLCPGNSSQNSMDSSSRGSLPLFKNKATVLTLVTEPNNVFPGSTSQNSPDPSSNKAPVVLPATAKKTTFQKYKKRQYCPFCQKPYYKLSRHLKNAHKNERDVALAYSYEQGSKQRKFILGSLMKRGNFSHNASVKSSGVGELVPCRRGSKSPNELVYCKFCLGLYAKNHLWRHVKNTHSEEYVQRRKKRRSTINDEASLLLLEESFYNPFAQDDMNVGDNGAGSDLEKLIEGAFDTTCLRETLESSQSEINGSFDETFLREMSASTKDINVIDDSQNDASLTENTSEATLSEATLSEATLSEATLSEATLSEATLSEATLSEATASKATASKATASEATASEATASEATASEATASEATASKATASKATASKATASKATASKATASEALSCSVPKKNGKKAKRPWTGEEVAAVQRHMTDFIARCRVPGRKFCDQCLRSEPEALKRRDWLDIKNFVHNRIMASKKKTR